MMLAGIRKVREQAAKVLDGVQNVRNEYEAARVLAAMKTVPEGKAARMLTYMNSKADAETKNGDKLKATLTDAILQKGKLKKRARPYTDPRSYGNNTFEQTKNDMVSFLGKNVDSISMVESEDTLRLLMNAHHNSQGWQRTNAMPIALQKHFPDKFPSDQVLPGPRTPHLIFKNYTNRLYFMLKERYGNAYNDEEQKLST